MTDTDRSLEIIAGFVLYVVIMKTFINIARIRKGQRA